MKSSEKGRVHMIDGLEEEYSYIVKVYTTEGFKYLFNPRTFVVHMDYAKRYSSLQSAQRVARQAKKRGYSTQIIAEKLTFDESGT